MSDSLHSPASFETQQGLIGADWCDADDGGRLSVDDPASGDSIGSVPAMGRAETARAIAAAAEAFAQWSVQPPIARADLLWQWHQRIVASRSSLAVLLTREQGKPLAEALGEIDYAASFVRFFAEEARRSLGEVIPSDHPNRRVFVVKQPVGVVACITPWNFPAAMVTRKLAPALAAGCCVVLKPAEATPLTALALCRLAVDAGFPPGVINVVTGDPQAIGAELCVNPTVRKISFTGSTATGRRIAALSSSTVKKLSLELGGNAPFIVLADADLDAAVEGAMHAKFRHSGQTCVCANRFFVERSVYRHFADRLAARMASLTVGPGLSPGVTIGPVIHEGAIAKIESHIADAVGKGAHLRLGGQRRPGKGAFFLPTLLEGVTMAMLTAQEEVFGPVASLLAFDDDESLIAMANQTEFGLAAYVYGGDVGRAWRIAERLECGMVGLNSAVVSIETAPFGGIKQSGEGREGSHHGLDAFLSLKMISWGLP